MKTGGVIRINPATTETPHRKIPKPETSKNNDQSQVTSADPTCPACLGCHARDVWESMQP